MIFGSCLFLLVQIFWMSLAPNYFQKQCYVPVIYAFWNTVSNYSVFISIRYKQFHIYLRNKGSFFGYHEVLKYSRGDQIHRALSYICKDLKIFLKIEDKRDLKCSLSLFATAIVTKWTFVIFEEKCYIDALSFHNG